MHKISVNNGEFIINIDEHNLSLYKKTDPEKGNRKNNDDTSEGDNYLSVGYYPPHKPELMLREMIKLNMLKQKNKSYIDLEKYVISFNRHTNKFLNIFKLEEITSNDNEMNKLKKEIKTLKSNLTRLKNKHKKHREDLFK